jgi:hypothetical protein
MGLRKQLGLGKLTKSAKSKLLLARFNYYPPGDTYHAKLKREFKQMVTAAKRIEGARETNRARTKKKIKVLKEEFRKKMGLELPPPAVSIIKQMLKNPR